MANVSSSTATLELTWVKSKGKGRYELTANGSVLGTLQRVGFWKPASHTEFKGQSWSFQRSGLAGTNVLQYPGERLVAEFKANWLGGGMVTFADGQQFQLTAKGFFRPVWSLIDDHSQRIMEITPHNKSVVLFGTAAENYQADSHVPVLIMLSWHQILQANDDAAAVAASVAAG
jgi:hypothetical protein